MQPLPSGRLRRRPRHHLWSTTASSISGLPGKSVITQALPSDWSGGAGRKKRINCARGVKENRSGPPTLSEGTQPAKGPRSCGAQHRAITAEQKR